MAPENLPYISVQADWDEIIREVFSNTKTEESFWIAGYMTGKQSIQGYVLVTRNAENEINLEGKDGFTVTSINSRSFKVECPELNIKDVTVFCPKSEFTPVKDKSAATVDISPNGNLFAAAYGSEVCVGNLSEGITRMTLSGHLADVTTVQFFPSNLVILTGGADFQVKIWSVLDGSCPVTLKGHTSAITSTAIISQGRNVLSSSKDGSVRLWNCGTSSTIATLGNYQFPVNKMTLAQLPPQFETAKAEEFDPLEVDTADKLVLVALGDGSVRGINLGTKKEIFSTFSRNVSATAVAYEPKTSTVITGDAEGVVRLYSLNGSFEVPEMEWKRNGYAITSFVTKLSENGETVLCVSAADGSVYQTGPLRSYLKPDNFVKIEAEYTGSELEPINDMKIISSGRDSEFQRVACAVRDGKVKIY